MTKQELEEVLNTPVKYLTARQLHEGSQYIDQLLCNSRYRESRKLKSCRTELAREYKSRGCR